MHYDEKLPLIRIESFALLYSLIEYLSKLTTDSAGGERHGVRVGEEALGVGDDLADMESSTIVNGGSGLVGAGDKRSGQAAVRDTTVVRSLGVGESETWWASLALLSFVDVCGCDCGRLIAACNTAKCNV